MNRLTRVGHESSLGLSPVFARVSNDSRLSRRFIIWWGRQLERVQPRWRRELNLLVGTACLSACTAVFGGIRTENVNLDYVSQMALERARHPFRSPKADLPSFLKADQLNYDAYREIRFRRERAL